MRILAINIFLNRYNQMIDKISPQLEVKKESLSKEDKQNLRRHINHLVHLMAKKIQAKADKIMLNGKSLNTQEIADLDAMVRNIQTMLKKTKALDISVGLLISELEDLKNNLSTISEFAKNDYSLAAKSLVSSCQMLSQRIENSLEKNTPKYKAKEFFMALFSQKYSAVAEFENLKNNIGKLFDEKIEYNERILQGKYNEFLRIGADLIPPLTELKQDFDAAIAVNIKPPEMPVFEEGISDQLKFTYISKHIENLEKYVEYMNTKWDHYMLQNNTNHLLVAIEKNKRLANDEIMVFRNQQQILSDKSAQQKKEEEASPKKPENEDKLSIKDKNSKESPRSAKAIPDEVWEYKNKEFSRLEGKPADEEINRPCIARYKDEYVVRLMPMSTKNVKAMDKTTVDPINNQAIEKAVGKYIDEHRDKLKGKNVEDMQFSGNERAVNVAKKFAQVKLAALNSGKAPVMPGDEPDEIPNPA